MSARRKRSASKAAVAREDAHAHEDAHARTTRAHTRARRIRMAGWLVLAAGCAIPLVVPQIWGGGKHAAIETGRGLAFLLAAGAATYWVSRSTQPESRAISLLVLAIAWLGWTGFHTLVDLQRALAGP